MKPRLIALRAVPMALILPVMLGGCVRTAASIVTFPVKAVGQGVDWATTSQDEADRNYGRRMRKQEAREERKRAEAQRKHDRDARRRAAD